MPYKNPEDAKRRGKVYHQNNKEHRNQYSRDYHWNQIGIDIEVARKLWEEVKECQICHEPFNGNKKFIDHDHKTGKIRGVLCYRCNSLLGYAEDNILIFENAIRYLNMNPPEKRDHNT